LCLKSVKKIHGKKNIVTEKNLVIEKDASDGNYSDDDSDREHRPPDGTGRSERASGECASASTRQPR